MFFSYGVDNDSTGVFVTLLLVGGEYLFPFAGHLNEQPAIYNCAFNAMIKTTV
jgi:hypothetical protein